MADKKKKFMIIDGNALIHRSFHALPPLTTKSGEMVNAVYGFTAVLLKAIRDFKPTHIALTLDRKEPTFRHKEYKDYKATRVKAPDELYEQIGRVKEIAQAFDIPIYELAGFEADDLIGTLAKKIDGNIEKIIVTGDLDALQLVNGHTKVFTMRRGLTDSVIYDSSLVKQRYGLAPGQMIDFKSLRGDPSDNIPGVRGIGEKIAVELLQNFKTLNGIYKNISSEKIKDRIRGLLKEHKKDAYMSQKLAAIKCDVKIKFNLDEARFDNFDQEKIIDLFNKLEFKSLLPRLQSISRKAVFPKVIPEEKKKMAVDKFERNLKKFNYQLIDSDREFNEFLLKLKKQKEFAFDTETASFDSITAELLGISFSWKKGEAYYVNFKDRIYKNKKIDLFNYKNGKERTNSQWLIKLKPVFENEKQKKYGHNIKYDIKVMASYGIRVSGVAADSMIASYLLNSGTRQHGLDAVTLMELGHEKISKEDLLGKGREKITFNQVPLDRLYNYSCEDADFTYRLIKELAPRLKKQKLDKLFFEIEMPLVLVLVAMEISGIKIDSGLLLEFKKSYQQKIRRIQEKIYKLAGQEFNINSTQQLREILFEKLGLSVVGISKTKTGISTGAEELEKLKDQHSIVGLIQQHRELRKLYTTYIDALPKLINPKTKRLHTSFNQGVTATGRLSSTEPNLQNIPVRTDLGREIRRAFVADKGYNLLSFDYSQIELRLAAHMSGDKKMIKAFRDGKDIHRATAAEINEVPLDKVTAEMRRQAKAINFGILYGQGPHGLSQNANISYMRAKEFIDQYFLAYRGVDKFINKTIKSAESRGYIETLLGRKRYLPELKSSVFQIRKAAERMAINTPLQGTAADIIKIAMVKIQERLDRDFKEGDVKMLLQVHDELLFEVKSGSVKKITPVIKSIMERVIKLSVPIEVDVKVGKNWGEIKTIKAN